MAKPAVFAVGDNVRLIQPMPPQCQMLLLATGWDGITPCKIKEILPVSRIVILKIDDEGSKIKIAEGFLEYAPFEVSKLN